MNEQKREEELAMDTQTLLNNVTTGTMKVLQERTNDMGINCTKAGEFRNLEELVALYDECYPWEETCWEDVENLLEYGYLNIDNDKIIELLVVDNSIYVCYRDIKVFTDLCECLIYDKNTSDYLLGFSNEDEFAIDAAIDLATQSVGYFNTDNGEYYKVFELSDIDEALLNQVMYGVEPEVDCEYSVNRIDN